MTADAAVVRASTVLAPGDRVAYKLCEAAAMLGVSPRKLKRLYLAGDMPAKYLGRHLMVPGAWIADFGAWPRSTS